MNIPDEFDPPETKMETMETGLGNTKPAPKRPNQGKKFVFTLNNPTKEDLETMEIKIQGFARLIWQEEVSTTDTPHIQGACVFKKRTRGIGAFAKLLGHKRTHIETMRGTLQDQHYCHKNETRKPDGKRVCYNWPRPIKLMTKEMLRPDQLAIAEKYKEDEDELLGRKVHWYWEAEGGWGKSFLCKYLYDVMGAEIIQGANKDCLHTIAEYVKKNEEGKRNIKINKNFFIWSE